MLIFGLGTAIALDPSAFGFTNVTDACGAIVGANCSTYEHWDGIHPTAAAHMVIANEFLAVAAVPEPSTWAMMILGFAGIGFMAQGARVGRWSCWPVNWSGSPSTAASRGTVRMAADDPGEDIG